MSPSRSVRSWSLSPRRMRRRRRENTSKILLARSGTSFSLVFERSPLVSLAVGIAWARDRAPQRAAQPAATVATSHARTTPVGPAPRKRRTRKPTVVAPKRTRSTSVKPARTAEPKVRTTRPPSAKRTAGFVPARVWSWPEAPRSPNYLVRFFRNGHKVLAVRTARSRLVLPKRFTFRAGRYRWTVVAISSHGKLGRALVNSTFVVAATTAGR